MMSVNTPETNTTSSAHSHDTPHKFASSAQPQSSALMSSPAPSVRSSLKRPASPDARMPDAKTQSNPTSRDSSVRGSRPSSRPSSRRLASFVTSKSSASIKSLPSAAVVSKSSYEPPIPKSTASPASMEKMEQLASSSSSVKLASEDSRPTSSSQTPSSQTPAPNAGGWTIADNLRRLTNFFKSGTSTPRALSVSTHTEQFSNNGSRGSGSATTISRSATPKPESSGHIAKGKLKLKIIEARGLGSCREPHVVAVFQRSQLISGPAQTEEQAGGLTAAAPKRPIPMQRTDSSQGRFGHAIPMRSRQSSNSSVNDFKAKPSGSRRSFTNPKWDAHGVFDVVDSDMTLDISVYEHDLDGNEVFYGHVTFEPRADQHDSIQGWYRLEGHADTSAERAPTGEIYIEATYQRSERKHFGPEDFEILRLIGKGTFGQVYQVRKKDTRRIYAMKVLSKKVIVQKKEVAHTVGERNILVRTATGDSPFIVGLKFSFQTPSDLYLVTDYMSGGELFWHLQKDNKFGEARAKFYIAELILAIQHLHENDIVYRDLKPENILLDANGHIALCDFGLSKANLTKNDTTTTFCGTTEYLAPEVLLDESGYTKMVDFWSLGVLVFEMCCGWSPFYADDTQQMYKNIAFGKVRFPRDVLSTEGRSFVKGLLNRNPKHRLGAQNDAEELKAHPFFNDINWDLLARKLITPPFKPSLKSDDDVSYFDVEFTEAMMHNGSLNARAAALARGIATSTPLSPSVQANFQGFTFVDESALEENMGGGYGGRGYLHDDNDVDCMDDFDHGDEEARSDDEWDEMNDTGMHRSHGQESSRGLGDDDMLGGHHFDP